MVMALYTKTEYSMLNCSIRLSSLIDKAKEYGYRALSITDTNMYGAYKFYNLCVANDILPIIGLEGEIESNINVTTKMLFYCLNNQGYYNLIKISSIIATEGYIKIDKLKEYINGIVAVTCEQNDFNYLLHQGNIKEAKRLILEYKEIFNDLYIGLEPQVIYFDEIGNDIIDIANQMDVYVLPLSQALFLNKEDEVAYRLLRAIDEDKLFNQMGSLDGIYHFKNKEELNEEFINYPYAFDNLDQLINKCHLEIERVKTSLPIFPNDYQITSAEYLKELCFTGLKKRLKNYHGEKKKYVDRIKYELEIIHKMGYDDYFLIVWDFVRYAKINGIYVGPGRGSAAGSLVSYSLGITDIDPLKYDLLFERFLNPERISMPDIDLDFPHLRRTEVIDYVIKKYGEKHVARIVTFDTYQLRGALRDVAKAMGIKNEQLDNMLAYIGDGEHEITNPRAIELLDRAKQLIGLPRHTGTHAAGIILSNDELVNIVPMRLDVDGNLETQFEAGDLENLGLLKIDFLALKNLTMIDNVVNNIKAYNPDFSIRNIPLDDELTYKYLATGKTTGLFQLESEGIRNVLKKLKPTSIEDIVAVLALYRPGPMDYIDTYIERKNGMKFAYPSPILEDILSCTYGIIIYQEQIMQIASIYAGYSLGQADVLRRAISKKKSDILLSEREEFINRAVSLRRDINEANNIYDMILKFASYGFNKSHSVAYAIVAYQTAYLKANYPLFFLTEMLNNAIGDEAKTKGYISEARQLGIEILGPDINRSGLEYSIEGKSIRYPLTGIKNIGKEIAKQIILERSKGMLDYLAIKNIVSSNALFSIIKAGGFDSFKMSKKYLLEQIDSDLKNGSKLDKKEKKEYNLEYDIQTLIKYEHEALGFNLSMNPLLPYNAIIKKYSLLDLSDITEDMVGSKKNVIGFISKIKYIQTKNNEKMSFFLASNGIIDMEGVIFPNTLSNIHELQNNRVYIMKVKIVKRNNMIQLELLNVSEGV